MGKEQRSRLDDRMAEQLLQGAPDAGGEEFAGLSAVLWAAAAAPADPSPTPGEEAAVAAFRAASADLPMPGRLPGRRRTPRWVKAGVCAVAAALTFGGVAVAVETNTLRLPFRSGAGATPGGARTSASSPARPSTTAAPGVLPEAGGADAAPGGEKTGVPSSSGAADPSAAGQSLRGLCAAYRAAGQEHGRPRPSTAPRRLVEAAGSEEAVADYCARLLASDTGRDGAAKSTPGGGAGTKTPPTATDKKGS